MQEIDIAQYVSKQITAVRNQLGLTRTALAKKIDIDPASLFRVESGDRRCEAALLYKIAQACACPIDHFFPPLANASDNTLSQTERMILAQVRRLSVHKQLALYDFLV